MILAVAMVLSCFSACGDTTTTNDGTTTDAATNSDTTVETDGDAEVAELSDPYGIDIYDENGDIDLEAFAELSDAVYESALGEFEEAYEAANAESNLSTRYALFAIAEAKLLESATLFPLQNSGVNYAMSRVVAHTYPYANWGWDADRYETYLVTNELITVADRTYCKELWEELKGTGTYLEEVTAYLTEQGYTFTDEATWHYSSDLQTFDILATYRSADFEPLVQCLSSLVQYDVEGTLQPALAESWEVSDDGLTWTFHIREGATWVDYQGRYVADVTADDWVAGLQHLLDSQAGTEYLLEGIVAGVSEYLSGEITDFSEVGIEAVDDYTLVYTLETEVPYFETMLTYNIFAPMSRSFYESKGGKFGSEYDPSASDYLYGTSLENIAYNGAYLLTQYTNENTVSWTANESYWNAENVTLKSVTWLYNDGTDSTLSYNSCVSGLTASCGLNSAALELALAAGYSTDDYLYTTEAGTTSYCGWINLYRIATANQNDSSVLVTNLSDEDILRGNVAVTNVHFRRALLMAFDRTSYFAQSVGDALAADNLSNSYTPGNFVALEEDVTVDINGTSVTYPAGTYYGQIVQDQLDADGVAITVWDAENNTSFGFDGWYDVDAAVAELEIAIEELQAEGLVIDEDNPIRLEFVSYNSSEVRVNMAQVFKSTIEEALGGLVEIVILADDSSTDYLYAGYYFDGGWGANYNFSTVSGWGPDFGDPSTYLGTLYRYGDGSMLQCLGIYGY